MPSRLRQQLAVSIAPLIVSQLDKIALNMDKLIWKRACMLRFVFARNYNQVPCGELNSSHCSCTSCRVFPRTNGNWTRSLGPVVTRTCAHHPKSRRPLPTLPFHGPGRSHCMTLSPRTLAVSTVSCVFRRTRFLAFIDLASQGGVSTAAACRSIKRSEAARFPRSLRFL